MAIIKLEVLFLVVILLPSVVCIGKLIVKLAEVEITWLASWRIWSNIRSLEQAFLLPLLQGCIGVKVFDLSLIDIQMMLVKLSSCLL